MSRYLLALWCTFITFFEADGIWTHEFNSCPSICTCRLEHLTETAIHRFMQKHKDASMPEEFGSVENNDVLYGDNEDTIEFLEEHGSAIIRSATCILQTETVVETLLEDLPKNIESLTIIKGFESGNKTVKFSDLPGFPQLLTLELLGPNMRSQTSNSLLICEIDSAIPKLRYLNLERVLIKNSKQQIIQFLKEVREEDVTFEHVYKVDGNPHDLTIVQRSTNDEDFVPYEVFIQQKERNGDPPLFIGFKALLLLRIASCELNSINWEMFDGLGELQYLILEKNNLRYIPPFAFHGTPNVKTLSLSQNKLLDIQITDLAGLLQLEYIDLSFNNFTQLSELSFPPFPNLKLANFADNPIGLIFPNTFEVMNTTNSLIIGSDTIPLTLITNSFFGLNELEKLTLKNLELVILKRDLLTGMPNLIMLTLNGNITELEYDAFLEVPKIQDLVLSNCQIKNISMDTFIGLPDLKYLDLSRNLLEYIPPGAFDQLTYIKELYLNGNKLKQLPHNVFSKIHPKLLRLTENPWHCSCEMSDWKPLTINKIKQRIVEPCDFTSDKGVACTKKNRFGIRYVYDNRVAPKCSEPKQFNNWNLFHAMRRILKCADYKPKIRKHLMVNDNLIQAQGMKKLENLKHKLEKYNILHENRSELLEKPYTEIPNNVNIIEDYEIKNIQTSTGKHVDVKKYRKRIRKGHRRMKNINDTNNVIHFSPDEKLE